MNPKEGNNRKLTIFVVIAFLALGAAGYFISRAGHGEVAGKLPVTTQPSVSQEIQEETPQQPFVRITPQDLLAKITANPNYFKRGTILRVSGRGIRTEGPGLQTQMFIIGPETNLGNVELRVPIWEPKDQAMYYAFVDLSKNNFQAEIVVQGAYETSFVSSNTTIFLKDISIIYEESDKSVKDLLDKRGYIK